MTPTIHGVNRAALAGAVTYTDAALTAARRAADVLGPSALTDATADARANLIFALAELCVGRGENPQLFVLSIGDHLGAAIGDLAQMHKVPADTPPAPPRITAAKWLAEREAAARAESGPTQAREETGTDGG